MDHNIELTEEAKELRKKYHREWQRANSDKVKEYKIKSWNKKAKELSEVQEG